MLEGHLDSCHEIVAGILIEGVKRGAFEIADTATTARAVLNAIVRFEYPPLLALSSDTDFEAEARDLVFLIVDGLRGQPANAGS